VSAYLAQARVELRLGLRNGEQLLVNLVIPLLVLVFFSLVDVVPVPDGVTNRVDFLAPGVLALAVMSASMVSLGIGTGFERQYGVLKRLGATPLGRGRWLAAKVTAVLATLLVQFAVLVPVALILGWRPEGPLWPFIPAVLAGTAAFSGIGLLMAGSLRGTTTLALANGLYLVLLLLGGMVFPLEALPAALEALARVLPAAALTTAVSAAVGDATASAADWTVLLAWAVAAPVLAAWRFRWH
jgi:ABC-2 type transport system permease protein